MSFFLGRVTGDYIVALFQQLQEDENKQKYLLSWDTLSNFSPDGPNINLKIWQSLDARLKEMRHKSLLPFINCTLHVAHNTFHKGIVTFRQGVEGLAYDLHAWFKHSPCKEEDFKELLDSTTIEEESLFLRHVDTRRLILCSELERIVERWDNTKEYLLEYLPEKEEYEKLLQKNSCYQRIVIVKA